MFGVEPTIQEIILATNTDTAVHGLVRIENGNTAEILLDEGRDAVKVKVQGAEYNGHVGWVSRHSLLTRERQAV